MRVFGATVNMPAPDFGATYQVLVPFVHGQVAESDGHRPHHFVHVRAQQLHQNRQPFLFPHCGAGVAGPLQEPTSSAVFNNQPTSALMFLMCSHLLFSFEAFLKKKKILPPHVFH